MASGVPLNLMQAPNAGLLDVGAALSPQPQQPGLLSRLGTGFEELAQNPLLGLGLGLLSAAGPSRRPVSVGQGLLTGLQASSQLESAQARNELVRQRIAEQARKREARERLTGLLGRAGGEDGGQRAELLGLLADVAPEAVAQGLLGQMFPQERAAPADIRTMEALGLPLTPEGFQEFQAAQASPVEDVVAGLNARLAGLEISEREAEAEERGRERVGTRQAINRSLRSARDLAKLNEDLEGTFLQAGVPASEFRRAGAATLNALLEAAGQDRSKQRATVAKFDKLRKGLNDLIIGTIDRFGGSLTNRQLQLLRDASANVEISPAAISSILADVSEIQLDAAEREGVKVPGREKVETFIQDQRERFTGPTAATIRSMSSEQVLDLASGDTSGLTSAQRKALLERIEEMRGGR